jgi:hypothetical protein
MGSVHYGFVYGAQAVTDQVAFRAAVFTLFLHCTLFIQGAHTKNISFHLEAF